MFELVVLDGGFGTRSNNITKNIPKPLVQVGNRPILHHIHNNVVKKYLKKSFINSL